MKSVGAQFPHRNLGGMKLWEAIVFPFSPFFIVLKTVLSLSIME